MREILRIDNAIAIPGKMFAVTHLTFGPLTLPLVPKSEADSISRIIFFKSKLCLTLIDWIHWQKSC